MGKQKFNKKKLLPFFVDFDYHMHFVDIKQQIREVFKFEYLGKSSKMVI
jgi:hypothetical protein